MCHLQNLNLQEHNNHHLTAITLAGTSSYELEDFVDAKFYCLHALADGNQQS